MKNKIIAYALDFASFLLEKNVKPRSVVLFGSFVSGEFDEESDIDIFVDIDESERKRVEQVLREFENNTGDKWRMKGIMNTISIKVGNINKWPELKRSIQSYGIYLYGKYSESPKNMKHYLLFRLNFVKINKKSKIGLWRKLYGYKQRVGKKTYKTKGSVESLGGKKLEKSIVVVPIEKSKEFRDFLNKNKIGFSINEIWTENI